MSKQAMWVSVFLAAVVVLATGCAAAPETLTVDPAIGAAAPDWCIPAASPAEQPPIGRPLPADFVPVSASRCTMGVVSVPGDGEWQVREEQRADGGMDELIRALRQPSESAGPRTVCNLMKVPPLVITLTDALGTAMTPAVPQTACGSPLPTVVKAIDALPWKTVSQTKLRRIRSQLEVDSGCPGAYKPVIDMVAAESGRRAPVAGAVFPTAAASLRVCRYTLDPTATITAAGQTFQAGSLASAATIEGADLRNLLAALTAAPPVTGRCDRPQSAFAVVFSADRSGPWVTIELDGCGRMLDGQDNLRELDRAAVTLLAG